jgi:hypothetical protein
MHNGIARVIELGGVMAVVYGTWSLAHWLGFLVGGVLAVVIGQRLERQ